MDLIVSILASSAISATLLATIAFLAKSWISERLKSSIKHEYDQKLESLKAILKAQNDVELERLRSQLAIAAIEHQVRFQSQHEKSATVIADVYRQTSQLYSAVSNYLKPVEYESDGPQSERRETVNKLLTKFSDYFYENRIYLPGDTAKRVESFRNKLYDVAQKFAEKVEIPKDKTGNWEPKAWSETWKELTKEINPLREELEDEFRSLLGVKNHHDVEEV